MNSNNDKYVKKFCKSSILEQLNEIKIHPKHTVMALNYMEQQIIKLGCMAVTAGTPEFQEFKNIKI